MEEEAARAQHPHLWDSAGAWCSKLLLSPGGTPRVGAALWERTLPPAQLVATAAWWQGK